MAVLLSCLVITASPGFGSLTPSVWGQVNLLTVSDLEIVGSTVFTAAELRALGADVIGKEVTIGQLQSVITRINEKYQSLGYITSRAVLSPQTIRGGVVRIDIIEGKLERIDIQRGASSGQKLQDDYFRSRLSFDPDKPLNFITIEEELQKLRENPLIKDIKATLRAGSGEGLSVLQVIVTEASSFITQISLDNYGNPNTGIWRGNLSVTEQNLTGRGDGLTVSYTRSGAANTLAGSYTLPLNPQGGTLTIQGLAGVNPIVAERFTFNLTTESRLLELTYKQPFFHTASAELSVSFSLASEESRILIDQALIPDGETRSTVLRLGQEYRGRDGMGGWFARSVLGFGIDGLGATIRSGAPDGRFFTWGGQLLRLQKLSEDQETIGQLRLQFQYGGDSLPPLNRFGLGGPLSVRGYRQGFITGDSGVQGTIEVELPLARNEFGRSVVKIVPFIDAGTVWNQNGNGDNQTLWGIGAGLKWQISPQVQFRLDYGIPLVSVERRGNSLQDEGIYFSLSGSF